MQHYEYKLGIDFGKDGKFKYFNKIIFKFEIVVGKKDYNLNAVEIEN